MALIFKFNFKITRVHFMCECFACICTMCILGTLEGQKRTPDALELALSMLVNLIASWPFD